MIINMHQILEDRGLIAIYGKDATMFLQNLITNDINASASIIYSYMLNSQGRYLFDFFIIKHPEKYLLIDVLFCNVKIFIDNLSIYKLRSAIEIVDVSDLYKVIYSNRNPEFPNIMSYQDPRFDKLGWRSLVEVGGIPSINFTKLLYVYDKYKYAIPDGDIDLIRNKSIVIEYGAEELKGVSYKKGCYIGQEVLARTKYSGIVRKKIYKAISEDNFQYTKESLEVLIGEIVIGKVCSAYNNEAIILVNEEKLYQHSDQIITINNQDVKIQIPEWRK